MSNGYENEDFQDELQDDEKVAPSSGDEESDQPLKFPVMVTVSSPNQAATEVVAGAVSLSLGEMGFTNVGVEAITEGVFPNLPDSREAIERRMTDNNLWYDVVDVGINVVVEDEDEPPEL